MKELWKEIPGYEGLYEVSNIGNVKSLNYNHTGKPELLKMPLASAGYPRVVLCREKKKRTFYVHQLVAMAFLGHCPDKMEIHVDHINNIKTDNRVENLQLLSARQNTIKHFEGVETSSKYVGVIYSKSNKKWRSRIVYKGRLHHIGYFKCEEKASFAYQQKLYEIEKKGKI
jgi:hypothetical protein